MSSDAEPPKVFISYSHDSDTHRKFVLDLSDRLREEDGIDCWIDQYEERWPSEGWQRWMEKRIEQSKFVLVICTPIYLKRFMGEDHVNGRGVNFEGVIISQWLYDSFQNNDKFIPVIPNDGSISDVPRVLRGGDVYKIDAQYEELCRVLTGQPRIKARPLGKVKHYPLENCVNGDKVEISSRKNKNIKMADENIEEKPCIPNKPNVNLKGKNSPVNYSSGDQTIIQNNNYYSSDNYSPVLPSLVPDKKTNWLNGKIVLFIGLIGSVVTILVFLSGNAALQDFFKKTSMTTPSPISQAQGGNENPNATTVALKDTIVCVSSQPSKILTVKFDNESKDKCTIANLPLRPEYCCSKNIGDNNEGIVAVQIFDEQENYLTGGDAAIETKKYFQIY